VTLACPICESHRAADYAVVGYGWQPGGVERFAVLRCRQHGVEFADALPLPEPDERRKESLDHLEMAAAQDREKARLWVREDRLFDPLRGDDRYLALMA